MTSLPARLRRSKLRTSAPTIAAALALTALPCEAHASPGELTVSFDAVGSSHITATGTDLPVGPTTLTARVQPDGTLTGSLPLPSQRTSFMVLGFVPVSATITFLPVGGARQVTGSLGPNRVKTKAKYAINVSNVAVAGLPTPVGDACTTVSTVLVPAVTPPGEKFSLTSGGQLTGTYTIPQFANCGITTSVINLLIPSEGNTIVVTVDNGRLGSGL